MLRALSRLPLWLYRLGLGWLLGRRFLRLVHIGRKSGRSRETVLEVVLVEPEGFVVASGFGPRSDWYLNLQAEPRARVQVGVKWFQARARFLRDQEAAEALRRYAALHPWAWRLLGSLVLKGRVPPMVLLRTRP